MIISLNAVRGAAPHSLARHEARIRFALQRVEEARIGGVEPPRADRLRIALDILDRYLDQADVLLATLDEDIESVVA